MPTPPATNLVAETDFAKKMGLTPEVLAEVRARALNEEIHFVKKSGRILYTSQGLDALLLLLETPPPAEPPQPAQAALTVIRRVPNPRQVLAQLDDAKKDAPPLVLRVPTYTGADRRLANHFHPGNRVPARHSEGAVWDYTGPRPRFANDPRILAPKA